MQSQDEIAKLKAELSLLRNQQMENQRYYEQRLENLALQLDKISASPDSLPEEFNTSGLEIETKENSHAQTITDLGLHVENGQLIYHPQNQPLTITPKEGSIDLGSTGKNSFTKQLTMSIVEQCGELFIAPFTPLLSKLKSFYTHYQQRGLAAVFLMTIAGIITLTLGFTYLLQYSLTHWLSDIGKVSFAFLAANTLLALGVFIYKRRAQMQDFASGLIGLGLIINYISAYFAGPYFLLIPDWLSLLLLLLITVVGFFLSFKFETKVVAVLSLVGGSLAPIMLFNINLSHNLLIYLPYLLLIGSFSVGQSQLLRWPVLTEITAFLHIACVELFIVSQAIYFENISLMMVLSLLSINIMFYLYGFSGLYWLKNWRNSQLKLNTRLLILPISLFAFTLLSMVQLSDYAGYIFLFNALLLFIIYRLLISEPGIKVLALFLAASFAGFAALQLLHQQILGVVLFVEGLALFYLGSKAAYRSIRYEAYVLIGVGLWAHFFVILDMISLSPRALSDLNNFGLILLYLCLSAATLYAFNYMLNAFIVSSKHMRLEARILTFFRECLSINYICIILYLAAIINIDYTFNIIPLISLLLLYLAKRHHLKLSGVLAWIGLIPLIGLITLGVLDVGNARFSMQPLYAQLARIELFVSLIGYYYWYKHFHRESKALKFARFFQIISFFILPLLFLPKVIREYPEFISLAMWLSVLISLPLAYISRHRLLFLEVKLITVMAIVVTAFGCLMEMWQAILALGLAAIFLAYIQYMYQTLSKIQRLSCRFLWLISPYYFALVTVVVVHSLMSSIGLPHWGIVMGAIVIYVTQLLRLHPVPYVLHKSYRSCLLILILPICTSLILHFDSGLNLSINSLLFMFTHLVILACLWRLFSENGCFIRLLAKTFSRCHIQWCWQVLLSICYLLWCYQFDTVIAAPLSSILLVIHGSSLMFVSLKVGQAKTIRLAGMFFALACCKVLLVDMANFLIIQKVIAFMVIGGILLTVSYFYQKIKNQQEMNC